jgi:hypothetical protein
VEEVVRVDRERHVAVAADCQAVRVLAQIHVAVLDADVRVDRFAVGRDTEGLDFGKRRGPGELMGEGLERCRHADHRADAWAPDPCSRDDDIRRDLAPVREDAADAAVIGPDTGDRVLAEETRAALGRPARLGFRHSYRVRETV